MRLDKTEQARVRHSADGFCRVIGCPECEVRRQERFGGKTLDKVRVEVVEGSEQDFKLARLELENSQLQATNLMLEGKVEEFTGLLREQAEATEEYVKLATEANERAQALGTEICGYVAAMFDLMEAPRVSEEMEEFLQLLAVLALNKLHEAGHRLAPVQPS